MTTRWGLGPVFAFECLINSRRWQVYALRSLFVASLLAGMWFIWVNEVSGKTFTTIEAQAEIGKAFYYVITGIALAMVLLAAPAATAGVVCLDKARGTLDHLLATDLSDAEIVLGKLAARLVPAVGMVFCALPVMGLATLLGGIDPVALMGAFLVVIGIATLESSLALTLSVWGKKTHEVLMATYVVTLVGLLAAPFASWVRWTLGFPRTRPFELWDYTNPFYLVFAPYEEPGFVTLATFSIFFGVCLLLASSLAALSVFRLRVVALGQASRPQKALRRGRLASFRWPRLPGWPEPTLDDNPVLWREWHRQLPSRWSRLIWGVYVLGAVCATLGGLHEFSRAGRGPGQELPALVSAFVVAIGMLLLSVSAATSLAEERVRGSLDVLLATPLSTATILWGKWWGAFRTVPRLAVLPLFTASVVAWESGRWGRVLLVGPLILAYGAGITSLGMALATWVSRLGRAVGLTVAAYVLVTVGWCFAVVAIFNRDNFWGPGLAMGSPFFGVAFGTLAIGRAGGPPNWDGYVVGWELFWIAIHGLTAAALFRATRETFDRCLGRVTDRSAGRPKLSARSVKPLPVPEWDKPSAA